MRVLPKLRIPSLVVLSILPALAFGLDAPGLPDLVFSTVSTSDGLSNDSVYCAMQDSRGFMWFGTFGGVDRYDGNTIVSLKSGGPEGYSLSGSVVFALAEGRDGAVWIGTDGGGLDRFDPESGAVTAYRVTSSGPRISSDLVYALAAGRDGRLWIGTGSAGLDALDPRTGAVVNFRAGAGVALPSDVVRALSFDGDGNLWVGCARGGVALLRGAGLGAGDPSASFESVSLAGASASPTVRSLYADSVGRVWIGTERDGLFLAEKGRTDAVRVPLPRSAGGEAATVRAIAEDGEGRIWVGTEGEGLVVLAPGGSPLGHLRSGPGDRYSLPGDYVRALLRDRGGLVWIGFKDRGISRTDPGAGAFGARRSGSAGVRAGRHGLPEGVVRGIAAAPDGDLWLAVDGGGLVRYSEKRETYVVFGKEDGLGSLRVCSVFVGPDGTIYAGTDGDGLYRRRPGASRFSALPLGLDGNSEGGAVVWALLVDSGGDLWVGLEGEGLVRLDAAGGAPVRFRYGADGGRTLSGRSVRSLLQDRDGSILVGTWDGGLHRIDPVTGRVRHYGTGGAGPSSTSDVSIYHLALDGKGSVWIGTGAGLERLSKGNEGDVIVRVPLGLLPKIPSVFAVAPDGSGALWLATESGLLRYDPDGGTLRSWTGADGLQDDHFAPGSFCRAADGKFAFGGAGGFNLFSPADIPLEYDPPQARIVSFVPIDASERSEVPILMDPSARDDPLRVPFETSGFSLSLAVMDYRDPDRNLYAVKIEGPQDARIYLGTSSTAIIPRLAPGRYRFVAEGAGNRGVWNENGSSIQVEVTSPFWMTPLFTMIVSGALALGIFAIVRIRFSGLERRALELREISAHVHEAREEERGAVAREVHDQLGQVLTALKMGIFWARGEAIENPSLTKEKLDELLGITDLALDSVKSISTRLRPKALDTLPLSDAIEWLLSDFRRWSGIEYRANIDPTPFGMDRRTETTVFRVLQEILTNVARHAAASFVEVSLEVNDKRIELRVRDDGRGIDLSEKNNKERSFGIAGMRERCAYLGGTFDIFPTDGGGTMVIARLPYPKGKEQEDA